jgi:hypothetical protein
MTEGDAQAFTVKDWLQRIDATTQALDEKIDRLKENLERKADDRDVRALADRVLMTEQQANTRLELWKRLDAKVQDNGLKIEALKENKADRPDVTALWRVLMGSLSGAAIAILAWALTVFH